MKFYTDVQKIGNHLLVRGRDKAGKRVQKRVPYKPYLFVPTEEDSEFQTIYGDRVEKVEFDTIVEANDFIKYYSKVEGFPIYGMTNYQYVYINDEFPTVNFDQEKLSIGYIDIEVGSPDGFPEPRVAKQPVTSIAIGWKGKYYVFACGEYVPHKDNVVFIRCKDEIQLLSRFLQAWVKMDLDIVVGWNNQKFDMPYIINRIRNVLGETYVKKMSPWGLVFEREFMSTFGRSEQVYDILGIATIDYMDVYKKHAYINQESYKLDHVAFTDCGISKVDYSEYITLQRFYEQNHQKFVEYNIRDVELIEALEDKHNLLRMVISLTYDSKINFSDAMGSVRLWDVIIHNELMASGFVVDPTRHDDKSERYDGAFVKVPQVGMHDLVVCYDVKSLYPSLVVEYNISPETLRGHIGQPFSPTIALQNGVAPDILEFCQKNNLTLTANGQTWDRSLQGFFPRIVKRIMAQRDDYKAEMLRYEQLYETTKDPQFKLLAGRLKVLQQVRKIQLNSLYGCMGNQYFRWFRIEAAEGITLSGQMVIQFVERRLNERLSMLSGVDKDYVIAIDTDSVYLNLESFAGRYKPLMERLHEIYDFTQSDIKPEVEKAFDDFYALMNGAERFLFMKLEVIASRAIWTAKKRYVMNVFYKEGIWYEQPKMKIVGLEMVKASSAPLLCRNIMKKAVKMLLEDDADGSRAYIKEEEKAYATRKFSEIAFPRGCNGIAKYGDKLRIYQPRTPFHVKGALFYNKAIRDNQLQKNYELVRDGDRIKFCELMMPNPIFNKIVSCPAELPSELGLEEYINYEAMFYKSVIKPLTPIFNAAKTPIKIKPMLEFEDEDEISLTENSDDEEDFFTDEEEDEYV